VRMELFRDPIHSILPAVELRYGGVTAVPPRISTAKVPSVASKISY
jgi:hypothetical protein